MPHYPVVLEILKKMFHLHKERKSVVFCWIPGHKDLPGNKTTKAATIEADLCSNLMPAKALEGDVVHIFFMLLRHDKMT
jgi:hypothetical protein